LIVYANFQRLKDVVRGSLTARAKEQKFFEKIYASIEAEFVAIYGRRRVGKTFLVKSIFSKKACVFFRVTGLKDGTMLDQLKLFVSDPRTTYQL